MLNSVPMIKWLPIPILLMGCSSAHKATSLPESTAKPFPSNDAIALTVTTMSRAIEVCRSVYERRHSANAMLQLEEAIGSDSYKSDMGTLESAEELTHGLISDPSKVSGWTLVALSIAADDLDASVTNSRRELLGTLIKNATSNPSSNISDKLELDTAMEACQVGLFNASKDFSQIVLRYIDAEDEVVRSSRLGPVSH